MAVANHSTAHSPTPLYDPPPVFDYTPYQPYREYKSNEKVWVFYRFQQNPEELWFPTSCAAAGLVCPRIGFSDGWTPANVVDDFHPERFNELRVRDTGVLVRYTHPHWYNRRGCPIDVEDPNMSVESVHPVQVIRVAECPVPKAPDLSFVVVRWGGEQPCEEVKEGHGGWGRTGSAVSDPYIKVLFEETVWPTLGPTYEVLSIFVRSSDDLVKLNGATILPMLKGRHKVAMYFLWPVAFQDNANSPGYINAANLLQCMSTFEGAGIVTRFPHHSHLYRLLLSKDWTSYISWSPDMSTAATTKASRALISHNPMQSAHQAITAIQKIKAFRGSAPDANPTVESRGVAKLGFSWEASDVRMWKGAGQLASALKELADQASGWVDCVIIQDFVTFDLELRLFWVEADVQVDLPTRAVLPIEPAKILYTTFNTVDHDRRFRDFERFQRQDAVMRCFAGDDAAMADAERQSVALGRKLLVFLMTECSEPLPVIRMDFMIRRLGPGKAEVHVGELTELGGCFLGWAEGPEVIWGAVTRSCFREECYVPDCRCHAWPAPFVKPRPRTAGGPAGKGRGKGKHGEVPNGAGDHPDPEAGGAPAVAAGVDPEPGSPAPSTPGSSSAASNEEEGPRRKKPKVARQEA